jgi:hypothetical protein
VRDLGQPAATAGCRICDEQGVTNQKRHDLSSDKLHCDGVPTVPSTGPLPQ